jgi:nucleoside-diphosphate-sugar epimerase
MILVTGGTGHLGANLVRRLLKEGERVRLFVYPERALNSAVAGLDTEIVEGDLRDASAVETAVKNCNQIYHCAAYLSTATHHARRTYECNVLGTRNVLRAALKQGVSRVVATGSYCTVGHHPERLSNETDTFYPFGKQAPYNTSKAFMEGECWKAAAQGLEVTVAIPCTILGPNDYRPSQIGRAFIDYANGKLPGYLPGGLEFVTARDIVQGHLLCMKKGRSGERYIFTSQFLTIDELIGIWRRVTGRTGKPLRLDPAMMGAVAHIATFVAGRFFPDAELSLTPEAFRILQMHLHVDVTKARKELGYDPTSVEDTIKEAYEWYIRRGWIKPMKQPDCQAEQ